MNQGRDASVLQERILHDFADNQVRHDLDMFTWLARVLEADRQGGTLRQFDPRLQCAMCTAALTHLQSLLRFLYKDSDSGLITACDYLPTGEWIEARPPLTAALHIAAEVPPQRYLGADEIEGLNLPRLVVDLRIVMQELLVRLPPNLLPEDFPEVLEQ